MKRLAKILSILVLFLITIVTSAGAKTTYQVVTIYFAGTTAEKNMWNGFCAVDFLPYTWHEIQDDFVKTELLATTFKNQKALCGQIDGWGTTFGFPPGPETISSPSGSDIEFIHHKQFINGIGTSGICRAEDRNNPCEGYILCVPPQRGWNVVRNEAINYLISVANSYPGPGNDIILNVIGWSRGGPSAMDFANRFARNDYGYANRIKHINIMCFDPVPGLINKTDNQNCIWPSYFDFTGFTSVKNFISFYAWDERTGHFAPLIPRGLSSFSNSILLGVPGSHESMVGNCQMSGHSLIGMGEWMPEWPTHYKSPQISALSDLMAVIVSKLLSSPSWGMATFANNSWYDTVASPTWGLAYGFHDVFNEILFSGRSFEDLFEEKRASVFEYLHYGLMRYFGFVPAWTGGWVEPHPGPRIGWYTLTPPEMYERKGLDQTMAYLGDMSQNQVTELMRNILLMGGKRPVADAGPDQTLWTPHSHAVVALDGAGSYHPGSIAGDILFSYDTWFFEWTDCDSGTVLASGNYLINPAVELPLGLHNICLKIYDGYQSSIADTVQIAVVCQGEFDDKMGIDESDLDIFVEKFGRADCDQGLSCQGDFDGDNDGDGSDLAVMAASLLRTDCPHSVGIGNPGFEDPVLPDDYAHTWYIPEWTVTNGGVLNPAIAHYPSEAPEGYNVAHLNNGEISQPLAEPLEANKTYKLSVEVGKRMDQPFPGYAVQLLSEGNLLAEESSLQPPTATFQTSTLSYEALPGDLLLGLPLEINLISNGYHTNFDNVKLIATPSLLSNPGFENPKLPDRGYTFNLIPGWTIEAASDEAGIYNPNDLDYPSESPEGYNVAWINGGNIYQSLREPLKANTTYILTVEVGHRSGVPFSEYSVQLLAGGNLLAEEASISPPNGVFLTSTVMYHADSDDPLIGEPLMIRLNSKSDGIQMNFDNVRIFVRPYLEGIGALQFDGVDDVVEVPHDDSLNFGTGPFTIEAWVRNTNTVGSPWKRIVTKRGAASSWYSFGLNGWQLMLEVADSYPTLYRVISGGPVIQGEGIWHHVAATRDASGNITLYVNGVPYSGGTFTGNVDNTETLQIGNPPGEAYGGETFSGDIDEVRLWNVDRTQAQIRGNMYKKLHGAVPNLVAYYGCDEGSGYTLTDETTYENHGILVNDPGWTIPGAPLCP